jgi:2-polyprenyl-3-methyl-5-hydroxy-6-metoxy-1,4-benzoquinol methylase
LSTIEQIRDYWDQRPCNIRHSAKAIGTQEYCDETEKRKYFVEPHIPDFADFNIWRGKKVLEIGCGIGTDTANFARAGAHVTAIDLSEKSLKVAKQRAEINGLDIKFYQGNAEELDKIVPIEAYDLIYSFGAIHHTVSPVEILKQIKKYLAPEGVIKIMVYHRFSWKVLRILVLYGKCQFWKLTKLVATHSEAETGCPVTHTYSRKSIKELLAVPGFKIRYAEIDHIFPYDVSEYKQYRYKKVWYFRWIPKWLFRKLERIFGWHLMITATT